MSAPLFLSLLFFSPSPQFGSRQGSQPVGKVGVRRPATGDEAAADLNATSPAPTRHPPTTSPAHSRLQCNIHIGAKSIKKTSNAINGGVFVLLLFGVAFVSLGGGGAVLTVEVGGDGAAAGEVEDEATDVRIKTACGSFQSAAGAFAWMRESGVDAKAVAAGATTVDVLSLLSPASPPNHLALLPALRDPAPGLALPRCRHGAPTPASAAAPAPASTAVVAAEPPPPRPAPPPPAAGRAHLRPRRPCPALPPPVASRA
uniref:Uncharacterized protein n=1 Tax=Oryza sativa subsp. japonica TaxID=39947 RepID=Q10DX8_ORYSJ|nr:hypothetical protein LOC_Os03g50644 [Oryza sativa Japonica Group]